jgi:hypothetical protein
MKRELSTWGYNWATLDHGVYKYIDLGLQVGVVSEIGTIKYGSESRGTQIQEGLCWRGPAATGNYRPLPPSRQRGCHKIIDPQLSKENFKEKEKLVKGPDGGLTPGQTGCLTVGCKITLTLT